MSFEWKLKNTATLKFVKLLEFFSYKAKNE